MCKFGILSCSALERVDLGILRAEGGAKCRVTALDFKRTHSDLFDLAPWHKALEGRRMRET